MCGGEILSVRRRFAVAPLLPEKSYLTANLCYLLDLPIAVHCGKYLHREIRGSCCVVVVVVVVVVVEVESRNRKTLVRSLCYMRTKPHPATALSGLLRK